MTSQTAPEESLGHYWESTVQDGVVSLWMRVHIGGRLRPVKCVNGLLRTETHLCMAREWI